MNDPDDMFTYFPKRMNRRERSIYKILATGAAIALVAFPTAGVIGSLTDAPAWSGATVLASLVFIIAFSYWEGVR